MSLQDVVMKAAKQLNVNAVHINHVHIHMYNKNNYM